MAILTEKQKWRRNPEPSPSRQLGNWLGPIERARVREAVVYIAGRYARREDAATALGMTVDALIKARSPTRAQTYRLACVVARAACVPVEKILSDLWPGDRCPHCGGTGKRSQVIRG
jgi:hypothetical protein|nr:hypothetical protein [Kofleriaceae bacterium]